jgi:fructoselysine 6-kinase
MNIAAFSSICIDHYPEQGISKPGGNSLNFTVYAKRFGAGHVALAGFIGTDAVADQIYDCLKKEGIDSSQVFRLPGNTASNRIHNAPDGERYSNNGDWDNGVKNSGTFTEATWQFLLSHNILAVPYWDQNLGLAIKKRLAHNLVVADFMHFDDYAAIRKHLPGIDIVFISPITENSDELQKISDDYAIPVVALLGPAGSRAYTKGRQFFQPALPVPRVIDTTGCGDSYQAAFACSYFLDRNIQKAMLEGACVASKILAHFGAV